MNKWIFCLSLIIIQLSANAQQRRAEDYYVTAFNEMSDMLAGRDSLSIKRAIACQMVDLAFGYKEKFHKYDEFTSYCASRSLEFYPMNPNEWIIRG